MLLIRPANSKDFEKVRLHLQEAKLVLEGLEDHLQHFILIENENGLVATAGLEVYGQEALLRSVAITQEQRGKGFGQQITRAIVEYAQQLKVQKLVLLTETAEPFFTKLGFRQISRDSVSSAVKTSLEFSGACPDTAIAMARELAYLRPARPLDAARIAEIYNQGIEDRIATFETKNPQTKDILAWFDTKYPFLIAEQNGVVQGFIRASSYRPRAVYAGIAEYSVYVAREAHGQRIGDALMTAFIPALQQAGFWKVLSRIFPENSASRALCVRHGFREVGIYQKHAQLDGIWRDCLIVERILV